MMQSHNWIGIGPRAKQCLLLLEALKTGPVSTIQARQTLGLSSPASRVLDLRRAGFAIQTQKAQQTDAFGFRHTTAVYVLSPTENNT